MDENETQVLGRRYNHMTAMWEALGLKPIADEVMQPLLQPGATMVDLLYLLIQRELQNP